VTRIRPIKCWLLMTRLTASLPINPLNHTVEESGDSTPPTPPCSIRHTPQPIHEITKLSETTEMKTVRKAVRKTRLRVYHVTNYDGPPLWSSGQSSWLQILRSRVRFPALPAFLRSSGAGTGSTQPREDNRGAA
jgi:hypothetical protein